MTDTPSPSLVLFFSSFLPEVAGVANPLKFLPDLLGNIMVVLDVYLYTAAAALGLAYTIAHW